MKLQADKLKNKNRCGTGKALGRLFLALDRLKGWDSNEMLCVFREAAESVGLILIPSCRCSSISFPVLSFYIV